MGALKGVKQAQSKIRQIRSIAQRVMASALRKGAAVIVKEMKARAPVGPKTAIRKKQGAKKSLKRRIRVAKSRLRKGEIAAALAKSAAPHSHLVEKGTASRKRSNGASTGSMTAKPFFEPSVAATKSAVAEAIEAEVKRGLDAAAARAGVG